MPLVQMQEYRIINAHALALKEKYDNVTHYNIDLTEPYHKFISTIGLQTAPEGFTANRVDNK